LCNIGEHNVTKTRIGAKEEKEREGIVIRMSDFLVTLLGALRLRFL